MYVTEPSLRCDILATVKTLHVSNDNDLCGNRTVNYRNDLMEGKLTQCKKDFIFGDGIRKTNFPVLLYSHGDCKKKKKT